MTEYVQPSPNATYRSFPTSGALRRATQVDGWIVPGSEDHYAAYMGLSGTPLNEFQADWSSSSFDVTIDTGEGYVGGKWLGIDTTTTVTLASGTSNQTVYVGWPADAGNDVIVGLSGDFPADHDKIPIWDFDTDSNGVTNATDRRRFEPTGAIQPNEHIPTVALHDGDSADFRVPVEVNQELTVTGWGAVVTSDDSAPAGLKVQLLDQGENLVAEENTRWHSDSTGVASASNTGTRTQWYYLRVVNSTGTDYLDPEGVSAAYAYELEEI